MQNGLLGIVFSILAMSWIEYWLHRWPMHRLLIANKFWFEVYYGHARLHHGKYYKQFDHEPDDYGRIFGIKIPYHYAFLTFLLPMSLIGVVWSPSFAICFFSMVLVHHWLWNIIHSQMHMPERGCIFKDWGWYKFLARYHYYHHRHVNRNFNVVFPFFDWLLGTLHTPTANEVKEAQSMGLL